MITFHDYLKQFKRKFVCLSFTKETSKALQEYCVSNGFDLTTRYDGSKQAAENFEFHTTVFYSDSYHNISNIGVHLKPFKIQVKSLELFGPKKNIPVLKLKLNENILDLRKLFEEEGFKDGWPEYKPHVSLSYSYSGDITKVQLPDFDLIVDSFMIKDGKAS